MRAGGSLFLYDWESGKLARRIDVEAKAVYWSEAADHVAVATDDACYILKFDREVIFLANWESQASPCFIFQSTLTHNDISVSGDASSIRFIGASR